MRAIMHLVIGLKIWTFLRLRIKRIGFVAIGFLTVTYMNGEIEKLLILSNNTDGLFVLIIAKNFAYLFLIGVFLLWPLLGQSDKTQEQVRSIKLDEEPSENDGFDFLRGSDGVRSKTRIVEDILLEGEKKGSGLE